VVSKPWTPTGTREAVLEGFGPEGIRHAGLRAACLALDIQVRESSRIAHRSEEEHAVLAFITAFSAVCPPTPWKVIDMTLAARRDESDGIYKYAAGFAAKFVFENLERVVLDSKPMTLRTLVPSRKTNCSDGLERVHTALGVRYFLEHWRSKEMTDTQLRLESRFVYP
jgi:hypothetical protein